MHGAWRLKNQTCPFSRRTGTFLSLCNALCRGQAIVNRMIDKKDMLDNYIKAEGSPLKYVESEDSSGGNSAPAVATGKNSLTIGAPGFRRTIQSFFHNDDPVSTLIAEKNFWLI